MTLENTHDHMSEIHGAFTDMLPINEAELAARLATALRGFYSISEIESSIAAEHIQKTPTRIVKSMLEMFKGCWEDPEGPLSATFTEKKYDEFIYVSDIGFVSSCAHHALPFFGKAHFGYLPNGKIVGLSKIPRLVQTFARRPQVQEKMTTEIVDVFDKVMKPKGCGLIVEAYHLCMMVRGVEQKSAYTKTTALRGCFKKDESAKQEFLHGVHKTGGQLWP